MAFMDELRRSVAQDGRSHRQIALAAGIHPTTFTKFMGGYRGLSIETIEQLAAALRFDLRLIPTEATSAAKKPDHDHKGRDKGAGRPVPGKGKKIRG